MSTRAGLARIAAWLPVGGGAAGFAAVCTLPWHLHAGPLLLVDPFSAQVALLAGFVGLAAAAPRQADEPPLAGALVLILLAALPLAALAADAGLTWLALEAATIAAAALLAGSRRDGAVAAAWRLLVLAGVGLALALFGTVLLYLAALPALGPGLSAMSWHALAAAAPQARGGLLTPGFAFLLVGYGALAALPPLHAWRADAEAAASRHLAALLGALPAVALVPLLRTRALLAANAQAMPPGPPLLALGLLALLLAAFSLARQRDPRRRLALAAIGQSGVAAFAFGLGSTAADFAGLLHLTLLTLARTAVLPGRDRMQRRAGRLTVAAGTAALAALPPFGLFASTFLIVSETARRAPWLLPPLGLGLLAVGWALATELAARPCAAAANRREWWRDLLVLAPAWLALALVLLLGLAMPGPVVTWFAGAARVLQ